MSSVKTQLHSDSNKGFLFCLSFVWRQSGLRFSVRGFGHALFYGGIEMALIKCPECGKEISDKAPSCIHCGFPLAVSVRAADVVEHKIDTNFEVKKVVKQLEEYRIRDAAFYFRTSRFTYDAFYTDVDIETIQKSLASGIGKTSEYEAIDFVLEQSKALDNLCVNPEQYESYANYIVKISSLMKDERYQFFPFGCWTLWLKNLNYNKLKNENIKSIAKILARGNFTVWTKGDLDVLLARLPHSDKSECMEYWGDKISSNDDRWKINSEALYERWLECKKLGQEFDHCEIDNYRIAENESTITKKPLNNASIVQDSPQKTQTKKKDNFKTTHTYAFPKPEKPVFSKGFLIYEIVATILFILMFGSNPPALILEIFCFILLPAIFYLKSYFSRLEDFNLSEQNPEAYQQKKMKEQKDALANAEAERIRQMNAPKCPHCNSTNIERLTTMDRGISVAAFGLASGKIGKQYKCKNCKHMW